MGGDQRVATELEEVFIESDAVGAEDVLEHTGHDVLGVTVRGTIGLRAREHRFRQRFSIQLAAGVERKRLQHHHRGGNHIGRQRPSGELDGLGGRGRGPGAGHDIGDELLTGCGGNHQRHRLRDGLVGEQNRLDLAQFDSLAAELDLEVGTSDVVDGAVGAPPDEVASAVHPIADAGERVGNEAVRTEVGAAHVPARELHTREVELPGLADGTGT